MWFNERKSTFNLITTLKSERKLRILEENLSIINFYIKKIIVGTSITNKDNIEKLVQLVERLFYTQNVKGSSPLLLKINWWSVFLIRTIFKFAITNLTFIFNLNL